MENTSNATNKTDSAGDEVPELELTDDDILDAMQHISGYLDITTEDFRTIYHLAHQHAIGRLFGNVRAGDHMLTGIEPLLASLPLDEAAKKLVRSGYKGLPVVDDNNYVIGMLTETDFLKQLKVSSIVELLLSMLDDGFEFKLSCQETLVHDAMSTPAVTITKEAGFREVVRAFHQHDGRGMPIVDHEGRLLGMLLRKDYFVYDLENLR